MANHLRASRFAFARRAWIGFASTALVCGCGGSSSPPPVAPANYTLSVNSTNPTSGVAITVTPSDNNGANNGTTAFTRAYVSGSTVTLTAPAASGKNTFSGWSGCSSATTVTCVVTIGANTSVTANYASPAIISVTVAPATANVIIGTTAQFSATVAGNGQFDNTVTWSVTGPSGNGMSPGSVDKTGLYSSPYPAPTTVTVVATSKQDPTVSGSAVVALAAPAMSTGPALSVDAGNPTHPISSDIYGMNGYGLDSSVPKIVGLPVDRWGGDATTRYNYLLDSYNSASDYWFENQPGPYSGYPDQSQFNAQVEQDALTATRTLGTVPMIGWTTLRSEACSFSVAKYGAQQATAPNRPDCGNGVLANGNNVVNDPTDTSEPIDDSFTSGWVAYLAGKFGSAANGGVAIYDLDNEPEWWDAVHRDVHPKPFTYDELTNDALTYAKAIKSNDPSALVSGPVISFWMDYFYSKADIESGWSTGPCYCANGNPTDRLAHGDTPLIDYYLQQLKAYQEANGVRLLDYVDLHTYFAADNAGLTTAGDTPLQQARLNSTRVFWDPTYTDPNYTDPNNRTSSAPPYPPQLIPLMQEWVANDYPGTKTAITEYNWGGQEHINGAVAQADILGIFGSYGLDLATLWGPPDPQTQFPGLAAFEIYRNYDGAGSKFGDMALPSRSANQAQLSVYGALRSSDRMVTIVVLNKTYGDLASTLSIANLTPNGPAQAFLYSNANLATIVAEPSIPVNQPSGSATASIATTFPAQSITLLVVPTA